ncbi:MAG TPA: EI24 domain-containing protein [Burkholderiales bacterium]
MNKVLKALASAARSLVHPIILAVMLVPMGLALILWLGIGWFAWDAWSHLAQTQVMGWMPSSWTAKWDLAWLGTVAALVGAVIALAPMVILTSVLIATLFAMPILLKHVAREAFPGLERRRGGTISGSVWNAFVAMGSFLLLWVLTLPLWLIGPLALVLPLLLSANLNQRLFRYDALSEHAGAGEMRVIFDRARGRLLLLGLITGLMYFIPPLNLVAPVLSALAFIHLCLRELEELRGGAVVVEKGGAEGRGPRAA